MEARSTYLPMFHFGISTIARECNRLLLMGIVIVMEYMRKRIMLITEVVVSIVIVMQYVPTIIMFMNAE